MALTTTLHEALAAGFTRLTAGQDAAEIVGYAVCSDSDIAAHRETVWTAVVAAMAQLVDGGFFARSPEAIRVVLVMDGGDEGAQCDWNVRLNGEDRRPELVEFFGLEE